MSDEKRAMMLVRAMDELRERYPHETSEWIRQRAEQVVEKKLGPAPAPMPTKPPVQEVAKAPKVENQEASPKAVAKPRFVDTSPLTFFAWLCLIMGLGSILIGIAYGVAYNPRLNAITQVTFETVKMSWWMTGLGFLILGAVCRCTGIICEQQRAVAFHLSRFSEAPEGSAPSSPSR